MHEEFRRLAPATIAIEFFNQVRRLGPAILIFIAFQFMGQNRSGLEDRIEIYGAIAGLLTVFPAAFRYFTTRFRITEAALELKSGLIFRQDRTIPLERIQNVTVSRSLIERALNVATLKIETASGGEAEASLSVVKFEDIDSIESQLRYRKPTVTSEIAGEVVGDEVVPLVEPVAPIIYKATLKDLLIAGATENRAGIIVASVMGLFGSTGVMNQFLDRMDLDQVGRTNTTLLVASAIGGFLLLLLVGWLASMGSTLLKYFDFTLSEDGDVLRIQHGLLNQLRSSIPRRRVQAATYQSPMLQRMSGFGKVMASSAGSFQDTSTGGRALVSPMVRLEHIDQFFELVLPGYAISGLDFKPSSKATWLRGVLGTLPLLALFLTVVFVLRKPQFVSIPIALCAFIALSHYMSWRVFRYSVTDDRVVTISGWLTRKTTIVPMDRIQWAMASQSPFQRRWGIAEVKAYTASATALDTIVIADIPYDDAVALTQKMANHNHQSRHGGV